MTDDEQWRPIPGYEGFYSVSSRGRVKSHERRCACRQGTRLVRERIRKPHFRDLSEGGGGVIFTVNLAKEGDGRVCFSVMRLVLMAFDRLPNEDEVAHPIDGNPKNVMRENLKWTTKSEISVANGSLPPWRKAA